MEKMTVIPRRWLLSAHILFAAIMFGVAVVFLILSLTAATTHDEGVLQACYNSMHLLAKTAVRFSTIATLVTGILLSVWTQWGLFKFYWIIAKEGLSIISIVLGPIGMFLIVNNSLLLIGIILQIISLAATYVISVFKPWGPRKQKNRPNLA